MAQFTRQICVSANIYAKKERKKEKEPPPKLSGIRVEVGRVYGMILEEQR